MLRDNLQRVRERIHEACRRTGRPPSSVTLLGVTKGIPVEVIRDAVALGLTDLGENRVQEAREKHIALGSRLEAEGKSVRWHLIGHLQSNKIKLALELFDVIQSVDSLRMIQELVRHMPERLTLLEVFVQVNVAGEATKFGCSPQDTKELVEAIQQSRQLKLKGLMTIPPFSANPEDSRVHFRRLRELRDALSQSLHHSITQSLLLSMGMSQDFEVAIEEGADLIRVGTAIFGARA